MNNTIGTFVRIYRSQLFCLARNLATRFVASVWVGY